jgi:hypothetical protein
MHNSLIVISENERKIFTVISMPNVIIVLSLELLENVTLQIASLAYHCGAFFVELFCAQGVD